MVWSPRTGMIPSDHLGRIMTVDPLEEGVGPTPPGRPALALEPTLTLEPNLEAEPKPEAELEAARVRVRRQVQRAELEAAKRAFDAARGEPPDEPALTHAPELEAELEVEPEPELQGSKRGAELKLELEPEPEPERRLSALSLSPTARAKQRAQTGALKHRRASLGSLPARMDEGCAVMNWSLRAVIARCCYAPSARAISTRRAALWFRVGTLRVQQPMAVEHDGAALV